MAHEQESRRHHGLSGAGLGPPGRPLHRVGWLHRRQKPEARPGRCIVQTWRTTEFAATDPDSQIDLKLEKSARGTKVTLRHTNIPGGQSDYKTGWSTCYFEPMKAYFKAAKKKP